jgi:aminoglycoside phosphotransferase (APT) family kinase protein
LVEWLIASGVFSLLACLAVVARVHSGDMPDQKGEAIVLVMVGGASMSLAFITARRREMILRWSPDVQVVIAVIAAAIPVALLIANCGGVLGQNY